ncbi:stalk domain-containing protein [Cohnella terricola]|uniref:Copper amine oxidase N-terminal domain-containing protein n=1 Tax=Cohnella terricola TaxID=1289167 RepID=A0A559JGT2_9BACL|nr:stalk domain-containing protein [Cohnella terricola]TVX99079.1 hypothetical protein FPZ45_14090 [Cohnella terricola]
MKLKPVKIIAGAAVLAAMLIAPLNQEASADRGHWMPIEVNIDGKILALPVDPVTQSGTTLVPMRAIFEALGAKVTWDSKTKKVTGKKGSTTVELTIGSKTARLNGQASQLLAAPQIIEGNTMIPLRYVSESLGMHVGWYESERQVYIATNDKPVEGTTMASIKALYDKYAPTYTGPRFVEEPSLVVPYKPGKLADGFLQNGLKATNFVREMVGLTPVILDSEMNKSAQYGAVLLTSLRQLTHTPTQPADMDSEFYNTGYYATTHSNIGSHHEIDAPATLVDAVKDYMLDWNTPSLGHRRWILNPHLNKIGFGLSTFMDKNEVLGPTPMSFDVMNVLDESQSNPSDYDYIAWPSKGYFPVSWLGHTYKWSVTLNPAKYQQPNLDQVHGTVTNLTDGTVLEIKPENWMTNGVNDENYGEGSIIYFVTMPYEDDRFFDAPIPGHEFVVELSGIYKTDGTPATVKYTVKLFAM